MKLRNLVIIFAVALLALIILGGGYFLFSLQTASEPGSNERERSIFDVLFPFGNSGNSGQGQDGDGVEEPGASQDVPYLRKVSDTPTAGAYAYEGEDGVIKIRYVERETGHVFETPANSFETVRISNATVPGIQQVLWSSASEFILRRLTGEGDIENFYATLSGSTTNQVLNTNFLGNWKRVALDPAREVLFTVNETLNGSTMSISNFDGSNERVVLSSPIRSWIPLQTNEGLYLNTAPAPNISGALYKITNQELVRVLGGSSGLSVLLNDAGTRAVVGFGDESGFGIFITDIETRADTAIPFGTIPEKCSWTELEGVSGKIICGAPKSTRGSEAYPNSWLLGSTSFTDDIWEFNLENGAANLLANPDELTGESIDVWQPQIDGTGSYLIFINKKDLSLWSLKLEE